MTPPSGSVLNRAGTSVRHTFRSAKVILGFFFFWVGGILLAWVLFPWVFFIRDEPTRIRVSQRIVSAAFRLFHRYLSFARLLDISLAGRPPSDPGRRPFVYVANHPTLVDVTAILSQLPHLRCITNPRFTQSPLFGHMLYAAGFLSAGGATSVLEQARVALEQQFDLLVFPEGTRSPLLALHPFHRGAFEIAKRSNVAIVPLLITCDPPALGKGQSMFAFPRLLARHSVRILSAIHPSDYNTGTELCAAVELCYRVALTMKPSP